MTAKMLKNRIFPSKKDRKRFWTFFSDFLHRRHPFAWVMFRNCLRSYFLGHLFGTHYHVEVEKTVCEPLPLWHLTYESLLPQIEKKGLKGEGFVFLTDDLSYADAYFRWKKRTKHRGEGRPVAIAIDVESLLREGRPLCKLVDEHKFITDPLPPEFLLSTEPIDAANLSGAQPNPPM